MSTSTRPGAFELLAARPRVSLGHWPTPLQPCHRLRETIGGPLVWLKRDDCSGLAGGGNKTRKLEFLLGRALAEGATGVVTFGALQSNHARQTAAACALLGLECDLILTRAVDRSDEHYLHSGNVLLDRVLGATVHVVDDPDAAFIRFAELFDEADRTGRSLFGIGPGGSDATGALGYVAAAAELADQVDRLDLDVARIVTASSTAGTAAGLAVGCELAGLDTELVVACVYHSADETRAELDPLIEATAAELDCATPDPARRVIDDVCLGEGYGIPSDEALSAIELVARTEGVLLDPVYTGKAFALLRRLIWDERVGPDRAVVFLHTGGSPGLFAYTPAIESHLGIG